MSRTKAEWRRHFLAVRRGIDEATRRTHSAAIAARILALPAFASSQALLTYQLMGAEVDAAEVGACAVDQGKPVYAAACEADLISWSRCGSGPLAEAAVRAQVPAGPILVLVPGVAFDERGWRLGRGGGYYDRSLSALRAGGPVCAVGVAYEMQVVAALPHDTWDQPMDVVATERRLIPPVPGATSTGEVGEA